ncbi:hypothetical protein M407DRAFT_34533 [Tulasnella calospora MUT 4182]|uniref:Uncharacterized protein n=1 Tax=Tulasnella calospora MUT 4182 TaxID=1051891 RepID=A0A0C3L2D6_9AGAM|nr:hypothetical protein M407DRAFT_34533 [Tulasnella calospora MUT 4182]
MDQPVKLHPQMRMFGAINDLGVVNRSDSGGFDACAGAGVGDSGQGVRRRNRNRARHTNGIARPTELCSDFTQQHMEHLGRSRGLRTRASESQSKVSIWSKSHQVLDSVGRSSDPYCPENRLGRRTAICRNICLLPAQVTSRMSSKPIPIYSNLQKKTGEAECRKSCAILQARHPLRNKANSAGSTIPRALMRLAH